MDLVPYLSTVIVVATLATVILAVFSYAAFKVRDRRQPREENSAPVFFRRYGPASSPADDAGEGDAPDGPHEESPSLGS
jgi:hypothetical protein